MPQTTSLWQPVVHLLGSTDQADGVHCIHPPTDLRLSLLESMGDAKVSANLEQVQSGTQIRDELRKLLHQLSVFEQMSRCPILGITGLLNSGKSSLLATYLSQQGRSRVLRGLSNLAGTHRFILWLPTRWRDHQDLTATLESFLTQLFGHAPEPLSENPDEATRQYNGSVLTEQGRAGAVDPMSIPLVAYDEGLDALRLGLLDCPDIQTGFSSSGSSQQRGQTLAGQRQRWLANVGRLCSAFIVMTKMNSLHDQGLIDVLATLRDAMPGVPRILAVNRVKARYAPETVADETRMLVDRFGIQRVFIAYDYRSALAHTRIPALPKGLVPEPDNSLQPLFFEVNAKADTNHPKVNYLFHLAEQLDAGSLATQSCRSLLLQLKTHALEAAEWHVCNPKLRQQQITDAWKAVAEACYDFMAERDTSGKTTGLRLQTSPAIVSQMSESLSRTAPIWLKPSMAIDRTARQLQQAVSKNVERFKLMQNASKAVSDVVKKFRGGEGAQVVTPERMSRSIRSLDLHDALRPLADHELQECSRQALERFAAEDQLVLDSHALDQWSKAVWSNMPWKDQLKRGITPLALATGPLLAALLVPFDGGGTAVLFVSAKELLAAAGITVMLGPTLGGSETLKIIHEETPWRQLSDLFAVQCDGLGLPRPTKSELPTCGSSGRQLLESDREIKLANSPTVFSVWKPADAAIDHLQRATERLN